MKIEHKHNLLADALLCVFGIALPVFAQAPASFTALDRMETRLGTLEFKVVR